MSVETQEISRLCDALPVGKRDEVAAFARFLLARQDDQKWERLLDHDKLRPRSESFLRESATDRRA